MSGINTFIEEKVLTLAGKIAAQRHLQAIRDGLILAMPLIIIGSLFLIIGFLPIPGYEEFMARTFGEKWLDKLLYPVGTTFDIMSLLAAFGIAYRLAENYKVDALSAGAISLSAYLLATPFVVDFMPEGAKESIEVTGVIPTALTGSQGLFVALVIALISTEIYRFVIQKNIVIKMPPGVPPAVSRSFVALIPGLVVILIVWLARLGIEMTSFESLHTVVKEILGKPLHALGGTYIGTLIASLLIVLLWACGLHGDNIVGSVMEPIWLANMDANRIAFQAGEELPNIFTSQFFSIFMNMGGSGTTLALVMAMFFFARSKQMKQLGKLAAPSSLFNINEPVIFGTPIVLNPIFLIPFILTPIVTVTISYVSMKTGLVAKPAGIAVPWTMPPIIGGYLATGGKVSGALLQLVNLVVSFFIYLPFFRIWDKQKLKEEKESEAVNKSSEKTFPA
ncbi:PTS cellobiose transporter subunit IIC [Peribacillus deserti]|uniref:Permease IIC component n=1 Tax=Peribacillus deserti TaxID=673318 RepID=A0A2N5M6Q7_9BACI|nr:PTS cellobiose transporter subunit IIC [Peribacillus deserti]PLT30040.1 PTS system, cellobiose-specific IIC component [Peribacillus deserti]